MLSLEVVVYRKNKFLLIRSFTLLLVLLSFSCLFIHSLVWFALVHSLTRSIICSFALLLIRLLFHSFFSLFLVCVFISSFDLLLFILSLTQSFAHSLFNSFAPLLFYSFSYLIIFSLDYLSTFVHSFIHLLIYSSNKIIILLLVTVTYKLYQRSNYFFLLLCKSIQLCKNI